MSARGLTEAPCQVTLRSFPVLLPLTCPHPHMLAAPPLLSLWVQSLGLTRRPLSLLSPIFSLGEPFLTFKYHPAQPLHVSEISPPGRCHLDCLTCISNVTWLEKKGDFTQTSTPLVFHLSKKHRHPLSCSSIKCGNCP